MEREQQQQQARGSLEKAAISSFVGLAQDPRWGT